MRQVKCVSRNIVGKRSTHKLNTSISPFLWVGVRPATVGHRGSSQRRSEKTASFKVEEVSLCPYSDGSMPPWTCGVELVVNTHCTAVVSSHHACPRTQSFNHTIRPLGPLLPWRPSHNLWFRMAQQSASFATVWRSSRAPMPVMIFRRISYEVLRQEYAILCHSDSSSSFDLHENCHVIRLNIYIYIRK